MEKHTLSRLAGFALALSVIFAGSTVYYAAREAQYERHAQAQHSQVMSSLLNSVSQLKTSLEKARYLPEGALRQTMAADIWKESQLASAALASLPLGDRRLEQIETYLSQVGDYAYYLLRSSAYDRADEEEWQTLCSLVGNASGILDEIDLLKQQIDTGSQALPSAVQSADADSGVRQALSKVNDEFPEYPSLIYDGPYSDHVSQRTPKALEGQQPLSPEQAREKAAGILKAHPADVVLIYESEGQIPCYGFSAGTAAVALTKQGGLLLSYTDNREIGETTLTAQQAIEKAQAFLRDLGLPEMQVSYHTTYEAILTANFHSYENDVLAYPDLIKVGVALDDGSVVRLEASGFAMNYQPRGAAQPAVSLEDARKSVTHGLEIQREMLCYIPTTGYREVLCWEFVCLSAEGGHVLQYINAETGQTENLLLLIENENGTLTR